ncbi:MAG: hypothetical protein ACI845_001017 [Gammaproteobacteria bacterium]|jgi:hypothetical protein
MRPRHTVHPEHKGRTLREWPTASRQIGHSVRHRPDSPQAQQGLWIFFDNCCAAWFYHLHPCRRVHRPNRMPYLTALSNGHLKAKENTTILIPTVFFNSLSSPRINSVLIGVNWHGRQLRLSAVDPRLSRP